MEITGSIKTFALDALPSGSVYTQLILKAGSGSLANDVTQNPTAGYDYGHSTGKDLSHVIYCVGAGGVIVAT